MADTKNKTSQENAKGKKDKKPSVEAVPLTLKERVDLEGKGWKPPMPRPVAKEAYKLWLTIPSIFLGQSDEDTAKLMIDDPDILELLPIRTQRQFAEWAGITENITTIWNTHFAKEPGAFSDTKRFFKKLTKNMLAALYRKGLVDGDAARVSLYLKVIEDWKEFLGITPVGGQTYNLEPDERAALDKLLQSSTKT